MNYTGCYDWQLSNEELADWYSKRLPAPTDLQINQYLLIRDENGDIVDKHCLTSKGLKRTTYQIIENEYCGKIKPKNIQQELVLDMLAERDTTIKLVRGVYGSGKDYLMLNKALQLVDEGVFQKIVFIRPNVTVANVPEIGFLKGTTEEKLGWTLAPLYDKVGGEDGVQKLVYEGQLEMVPLLFIRGRSFENSIVYVCEGQNITTEIAKLIISRIGEGSELWINADNHQTDNKIYEKDNGIVKMVEKLTGNELFKYVYMPITERGKTAALADLLDE